MNVGKHSGHDDREAHDAEMGFVHCDTKGILPGGIL